MGKVLALLPSPREPEGAGDAWERLQSPAGMRELCPGLHKESHPREHSMGPQGTQGSSEAKALLGHPNSCHLLQWVTNRVALLSPERSRSDPHHKERVKFYSKLSLL